MSNLPADTTLADLRHVLADSGEFVRQVSGVMHSATKEHGPVVMRLGITGTGRLPNYRLESLASGAPLLALDGNSHKPWPEGADFTGAANWSRRTRSLEDVRALLGEVRGLKR